MEGRGGEGRGGRNKFGREQREDGREREERH